MTVLDTHALVWWTSEPARLSSRAKRTIQSAAAAGELIVSAASLLEIATLIRRGRLQFKMAASEWLDDVRSLPEIQIEPVTAEIAVQAGSFDSGVQGDPIDRLIIATAFVLGDSLVSADKKIRSIDWVRTIW